MNRLTMNGQKPDCRTILSWLLAIASPFILLIIVSLLIGQNALAARPVWTDENAFWRALYSWHEAGMTTGFNGMFEETAPMGTLGTSGIGPILIYGGFVKIFGLTTYSIMLCNAVWIALGMAVFCLLRRPPVILSMLLSGLVLLFPPIIMYCLTSMTELVGYALVLLYLAFLMNYIDTHKAGWLCACCLLVMFACLYRPMYCVLFVPMIVIFGQNSVVKWIVSALVAAVLGLGCGLLGLQSAAPTTQGFLYHLLHAPNFSTFWQMLLSHTKADLLDYFGHAPGGLMQYSFRILYLIVLALAGFGIFFRAAVEDCKLKIKKEFSLHMLCVFVMLLVSFTFVIMLYETNDWRDYRRLAPFLWMALLYPLARGRYDIPVISMAGCTILVVLMLLSPAEGVFMDTNRFDPAEQSIDLQVVADNIIYDENASDPFDNTVRLDVTSLSVMQALDPRLGLQTGWFSTESTGKSRWILTDYLKCPISGYEKVLDLEEYKVYRKTGND